MISGIAIKNFKGVGAQGVSLDLAPITMLFGNNNSGKSTIFQAMSLADAIFNEGDRNPEVLGRGNSAVNVGGFENFVHEHDLSQEIELQFTLDLKRVQFDKEWEIEPTLAREYGQLGGVDMGAIGDDIWNGVVAIHLAWDEVNRSAKVTRYSVALNGEHLLHIDSPPDTDFTFPTDVNTAHPILRWPDAKQFGRNNSYGVLDELISDFRSDIVELFQFAEEIPREQFPEVGDAQYTMIEREPDESVQEVRVLNVLSTFDQFPDYLQSLCEDVTSHSPDYDDVRLYFLMLDNGKIELAALTVSNPVDARDGDVVSEIVAMMEEWIYRIQPTSTVSINQEDALPSWSKPLPFKFTFGLSIERADDLSSRFRMACELLNRLVVVPGRVLARELEQLRHVGPLRKPPPREMQIANTRKQNEDTQWYDGSSAWHAIARSQNLASAVSVWLSNPNRLGMGYELGLEEFREVPTESPISRCFEGSDDVNLDLLEVASEAYRKLPRKVRIRFTSSGSHEDLDAADLAIGFNQIIPVLAVSLDDKPGLTLVEQPELHIHPAVEVGLGDLFIHGANSGKQFLLETHGEHLMLRVLRRIREATEGELPDDVATIDPNDLAVYFLERTDEGVTAQRLRVDSSGEFVDKWPKGFFRERAEELF